MFLEVSVCDVETLLSERLWKRFYLFLPSLFQPVWKMYCEQMVVVALDGRHVSLWCWMWLPVVLVPYVTDMPCTTIYNLYRKTVSAAAVSSENEGKSCTFVTGEIHYYFDWNRCTAISESQKAEEGEILRSCTWVKVEVLRFCTWVKAEVLRSCTWVKEEVPECTVGILCYSKSPAFKMFLNQIFQSTLLSIFKFVCTDREIEILFPTIP